jgi:hypothetical protein
MTKVNFASNREQAEKEGLISSGSYLKLQEGDNRIRLMSECLPHSNEYKGKKRFQWLCYIIDRKDGRLKPLFMAHTIYKQIEALQLNQDYVFDEVPMPYDLTISAKGAGSKEVVYTIVHARQNTPLTPAELEDLKAAKPIRELQQTLQEQGSAEDDGDPGPVHEGPSAQSRYASVPPEFRPTPPAAPST